MPYTIAEHQHRSAAWDAATSARASKLCRFTVSDGIRILERTGFNAALASPEQLPAPETLDREHLRWREAMITEARELGLIFTHGIAAKLINSYLKVRFVCANHHGHERVKGLHPPIDRILLETLGRQNVGGYQKEWSRFGQAAWSKFDSATYQGVIDLMRGSLPLGVPLWMIEEHWIGHS